MDIDKLTLDFVARRLVWLCGELKAGKTFSSATLNEWELEARLVLRRAPAENQHKGA